MKWLRECKLLPSQWFLILTMMVVINFSIKDKNPIFIVVLLPFGLLWFYEKWKWIQILGISLICLSFGLITGLIQMKFNLNYVNNLLNNSGFYSLRMKAVNFIGMHYNPTDASFLRLLLLNYRDQNSETISQNVNNLSVGFLFVVSGLHINLLLLGFKWIFKNKQVWIYWLIGLCLVIGYGYFLGFTVGI